MMLLSRHSGLDVGVYEVGDSMPVVQENILHFIVSFLLLLFVSVSFMYDLASIYCTLGGLCCTDIYVKV